MATHEMPANQQQYLTFFLADEQYAVGVLRVKEIIEYGVVTRVPTTPPYIRGVINLRGSVVPVVDLSVKFGLQECPVSRRTCIIIMETMIGGERATMGVVADSVSQVTQYAPHDIEAAPAFGTRVRMEYLEGMAKMGSKFVLILNMDAVFAADEIAVPHGGASSKAAAGGTSEDATAA
jgi:purine-binding chemotaxis protein CheW